VTVRCATCGQATPAFDAEAAIFTARLSHLQARIFRALASGDGQFVSWSEIAAQAYSTDPAGGPDDVANVISAMVHRMRAKLRPLGLSIDGHKGGDGGYRLSVKEDLR